MDRTWIVDGRGLVGMVKNAGSTANETNDCGASLNCLDSECQHKIHSSDVSRDPPRLPAGVKFDPSDADLLEHLAAKSRVGGLEPHELIDGFILTLESDKLGINYTHPANLPGAKMDGSSVHFFYKVSKAYTTGKRKRRRIENQENAVPANVRWHKTGRTKVVMKNGVHKGYKKIMVLYSTSKGGTKSEKCKWIMHQYHLGNSEEEKEGEYVVSKVFYQPQTGTSKNVSSMVISESEMGTIQIVPRTPNMIGTPEPLREVKTALSDFGTDDCSVQDAEKDGVVLDCLAAEYQAVEFDEVDSFPVSNKTVAAKAALGTMQDAEKDGVDSTNCFAAESQASFPVYNKMNAANATFADYNQTNMSLTQAGSKTKFAEQKNVANASFKSNFDEQKNVANASFTTNFDEQKNVGNASFEITDLELGTPPYFQVNNELQITPQDHSLFDWLAQII